MQSMNGLRLTALNAQDSLASNETQAAVEAAAPDILCVAEALAYSTDEVVLTSLQHYYGELGYVTHFVASQDSDDRNDQHYLAVLVRKSITHQAATVWLGTRNAIAVTIGNTLILSVHLDDRLEATRVDQVATLMKYIDEHDNDGEMRVLVVGDFNATHPSAFGAVLGVTARGWTKLGLPVWQPSDDGRTRLGRVGGLLTRLGSMATSRALAPLNDFQSTFVDADCRHRPTMPTTFPLVQLDHIFGRGLPMVFEGPVKLGSGDHRAISVTLPYLD